MDELKLQVVAFQKELGDVVKALAAKHNLTLAKNNLRYDSLQWKTSLVFNVKGKEAELKQSKLLSFGYDESDPQVGSVLGYKRTSYKVMGYNRGGSMIVSRVVDNKEFRFKRNRITNKYDYFQNELVASSNA